MSAILVAGKRQGEKDPRHLWPYILKHVRAIRPVWCFWENVAGHTTMGLWRVLSDLEEEGYRCAWGIFQCGRSWRSTPKETSVHLGLLRATPNAKEGTTTQGAREEAIRSAWGET
jgi:hypothetical protein